MKNIDKKGIELLNRLYRDMYKSEDVMYNVDERFVGNKIDNISHYIIRMQELHERVGYSGRKNDLRILKGFYYRKYVIKEEDIPESYYEQRKNTYLEKGYGCIELTEKVKHKFAEEIIDNQKRSLDIWIDYLVSDASSYIPFWAKYWIFRGILSVGNYNKKSKTFSKRSKSTILPFMDLNCEALALSIDVLLKSLNKKEINNKELEVLVQGGSFGKIYLYILENVLRKTRNSKKVNEGKWVKYERGSDHIPLVKSLQGYNTGWCTTGEMTAKWQLSQGDFYVYYTYNENEEAVVPRIAIRMDDNQVVEVRGITKEQNIEPEMEVLARDKLNELSGSEDYNKKVTDMERLTTIYNKFKENCNFNKDELKFLYELDDQIEGFGYEKDPRINEILESRDQIIDLNYIFDGADIYDGDLFMGNLTVAKGLKFPKTINGNLYIDNLINAEGVIFPEIVNGSLDLWNLKTTLGLILPKIIKGDLNLRNLISSEGLLLPNEVSGNLDLRKLTNIENLILPEIVNGYVNLSSLKKLDNVVLPKIFKSIILMDGVVVTPENVHKFINVSKYK